MKVISNMDAKERRKTIIELLREKKEMKVTELKSMFNISGVTLRNDLIFIENEGLIQRNFGSVILKEDSFYDIVNRSSKQNIKEKNKIGNRALEFIKENESILLYTGSTGLQIAKGLIYYKNLIVVTNSIITAWELGKNPYIKTILLGGYFNPGTSSVFGEDTIKQLDEYNIDKLFLSVNGISSLSGVTSEHPYEREINRAMIEKAREVIVVADYSKVGTSRFVNIAGLNEVDMLITDNKAPEDELEKIRGAGVKVIVA